MKREVFEKLFNLNIQKIIIGKKGLLRRPMADTYSIGIRYSRSWYWSSLSLDKDAAFNYLVKE